MDKSSQSIIAKFIQLESASGIMLFVAAVLALIFANSSLESLYKYLLETPVQVSIGELVIAKPLLLWINDGLMAIFFFVVGLELKRELIDGELSDKKNIILPGIGALGGMLAPAIIYVMFNYDNPDAMQGWAIPAATDIAFALGVLALLGSRVPVSIKIFLTSLAIFDDVGAIIIIALFYTANISVTSLVIVSVCIPLLYLLNRYRPDSTHLFIIVGIIMWVAMLKSGVHATLTGVILAMFIPMKSKSNPEFSPLRHMEHKLHSTVAFYILPIFAFANAGINLSEVGLHEMMHDIPFGIACGLFIGKQLGVFGVCWLAIKLKFASLPKGMSWWSLYGTAALCGIGFTMSLFIGSLAFEGTGIDQSFDERLGILIGSLFSGIVGYFVLRASLRSDSSDHANNEDSDQQQRLA